MSYAAIKPTHAWRKQTWNTLVRNVKDKDKRVSMVTDTVYVGHFGSGIDSQSLHWYKLTGENKDCRKQFKTKCNSTNLNNYTEQKQVTPIQSPLRLRRLSVRRKKHVLFFTVFHETCRIVLQNCHKFLEMLHVNFLHGWYYFCAHLESSYTTAAPALVTWCETRSDVSRRQGPNTCSARGLHDEKDSAT